MVSTADETARLLESYGNSRDPAAREQLVANYMPLVHNLARRFQRSKEPQEDLVQIGAIGLLRAIDKFDLRHRVKFASLAIPEILGAILNYLRDHGCLVKAPRTLRTNRIALEKASDTLAARLGRWPTVAELADKCDLSERDINEAREFARNGEPRSLDQCMGAEDGETSPTLSELVGSEESGYEAALDRMTLEAALRSLPLREKTIITLKFYRGMSQRQIAQRVHLSQMHVSRLERSALSRLRHSVLGDDVSATSSVTGPRIGRNSLSAAS